MNRILTIFILSCGLFASCGKSNKPKYCRHINCVEPLDQYDCPSDSVFVEDVDQENCCSACVKYLGLDDNSCTGTLNDTSNIAGSITSQEFDGGKAILISTLCSVNLTCNDSSVCVQNPDRTPDCKTIQYLYDKQTTAEGYLKYRDEYRWRPNCTSDGFYAPTQCKGSDSFNSHEKVCVCVDEEGQSLFGKSFQQIDKENIDSMNCLCSRKAWEMTRAGVEIISLHCTENGNFEELQCEEGWCYCVNVTFGKPYGTMVPQVLITSLPCYNRTLIGEIYERRCESEYYGFKKVLIALETHKVPERIISNVTCSLDGSYAPKQCHDSDDTARRCRCYDKYNEQIYEISGDNCNCARDKLLLNSININPQCAHESGAYHPLQNRTIAETMVSFCVDVDGIRTGPKVFFNKYNNLNCDDAVKCQMGDLNACETACSGCKKEDYFYYEHTN